MLVGLWVLLMPLLVVRAEVALPVERCDANEGSCYLENAYRRWTDRIPCKVPICPPASFLWDMVVTLFGHSLGVHVCAMTTWQHGFKSRATMSES